MPFCGREGELLLYIPLTKKAYVSSFAEASEGPDYTETVQ